MANEATISVGLRFEKGGVSASYSKGGLQVDVSGSKFVDLVQEIGTSEEQLDFGDVTTPGYVVFENLDSTNYIEIRPGTGVADLVRLNAGEVAVFRLAADATAPYAMANTAACNLRMLLLEN